MKRTAAVLIGMVGLGSQAFGGIVLFGPDAILWDRSTQGDPGTIGVDVLFAGGNRGGGPLGSTMFDAFDSIFGAPLGTPMNPSDPAMSVGLPDFNFSPMAITDFPNRNVTPDPGFGVYGEELYVSANRSGLITTPINGYPTGVLRIDLTGLPDGDYIVQIDSEVDGGITGLINRGVSEPLANSMPLAIRIVPEPASLSLLGLGALAALRFVRRRTN